MIVEINKENETVTYSTTVIVGERKLLMSVTKLLYYAKSYHLDHALPMPAELVEKKVTLFEVLFYWPEEYYTNEKRSHHAYNRLIDTNYNYQSKKDYEVQWKEN